MAVTLILGLFCLGILFVKILLLLSEGISWYNGILSSWISLSELITFTSILETSIFSWCLLFKSVINNLSAYLIFSSVDIIVPIFANWLAQVSGVSFWGARIGNFEEVWLLGSLTTLCIFFAWFFNLSFKDSLFAIILDGRGKLVFNSLSIGGITDNKLFSLGIARSKASISVEVLPLYMMFWRFDSKSLANTLLLEPFGLLLGSSNNSMQLLELWLLCSVVAWLYNKFTTSFLIWSFRTWSLSVGLTSLYSSSLTNSTCDNVGLFLSSNIWCNIFVFDLTAFCLLSLLVI